MTTSLRIGLITCALFTALPCQAETLGRLFYSPQEREQIEYQNIRNGGGNGGTGYIVVNGVVQKQGGKRMVWINGRPQQVDSNERAPASVPITLPGKRSPVEVKVGQRILLEAGNPDKP